MGPLSQIREAVRQYIYCYNGYHGPHDPYNYTVSDDWDKAEKMLREVCGATPHEPFPPPFCSDWDERPVQDAGKKAYRLVEFAQDLANGQAGYYDWRVDWPEARESIRLDGQTITEDEWEER